MKLNGEVIAHIAKQLQLAILTGTDIVDNLRMIRLSEEEEPEIFATTKMKNTIIENVVMKDDGELDLENNSITENTRGAYPLDFIPGVTLEGKTSHPKNIIMLTADAFGVLPPIAKLTPDQAMYHFLSGYTAKVAGTEMGLSSEPTATFSPCFGGPFLTLHPLEYAQLLREKINKFKVPTYLVNTGWVGATAESGAKRISLPITRQIIYAILDGSINKSDFEIDPYFGVQVPKKLDNIETNVLIPITAWPSKEDYIRTAESLVEKFQKFFHYLSQLMNQCSPLNLWCRP